VECSLRIRQFVEAGGYGSHSRNRWSQHLRSAAVSRASLQSHQIGYADTPQFAKAAGARVRATASSAAKAELLKSRGADHVLNYKADPNWGETALKLTPDGLGVHHVIAVGDPKTISQSFSAVRQTGVITVVGFLLGQTKEMPSYLEVLLPQCVVRGIVVNSRVQFEDMNQAIDATGIKPVVDEKVFGLEELREAYQYMVSPLDLG